MLLPLLLNNLQGTAPTMVLVPDVVGQTQAAGTATLTGVLFVVAVTTANSSTIQAGKIISQDPIAGTSAIEGSTVTITVSLGDAATSGGFFMDFDAYGAQRRKRKKQVEEIEEQTKQIPDDTSREIAELLHAQEAKDAERDDLARLQRIADQYAGTLVKAGVPRPVAAAVLKAHEERTANALEQMRREIERMMDEEEQAIIALLLMDD